MVSIAIQFHNVSCTIKGQAILRGITFETRAGEIDGILGPNGAGKSTLLSLICGLRMRFDGSITVLGSICRYAAARCAGASASCSRTPRSTRS